MSLHGNIKNTAKVNGITLRALEKECGLTPGCITKWKYVSPGIENVKKVADVLGVSIDDLLD